MWPDVHQVEKVLSEEVVQPKKTMYKQTKQTVDGYKYDRKTRLKKLGILVPTLLFSPSYLAGESSGCSSSYWAQRFR